MTSNIFEMSHEDFFAVPLLVSPEVGKRLIREGFRGLRIGGPDMVNLDKHSRFPIAAVRVDEAMEASRHLFKEFALITAMDLLDGTLHAGFFVEQKFAKFKRDLDGNPPPPGKVADAASVNLFARLGLPKRSAEYLVTAILFDQPSNRIRVKVGASEVLYDEEAFRKALDWERAPGKPRIRLEGVGTLGNGSLQLAPPHEPGIVLNAYLEPVPENSRPVARLQVAFHVPRRGRTQYSSNEEVTAGIPITVLATGTRVSAPLVWNLEYVDSDPDRSNHHGGVRGRVEIRLSDLDGLERGQTYALYAFSGELMSKPVLLRMD